MGQLLTYPPAREVDQDTDGRHDYHQFPTNFQGPSFHTLVRIHLKQQSTITISKVTFKNHHPSEQWKGLTLTRFRILHSSNQEACQNKRQRTPTDLTGLGRQCNS